MGIKLNKTKVNQIATAPKKGTVWTKEPNLQINRKKKK